MTGKRFTWLKKDVYAPQIVITDSLTEKDLTPTDCYELLNELYDKNEKLKAEINMLKTTIGRNEAHIQQMKHKGEWK